MDLYHSWIYEHLLNGKWFIWTVVIIIFFLNLVAPVHIWFVMNSKELPWVKKKKRQKKRAN